MKYWAAFCFLAISWGIVSAAGDSASAVRPRLVYVFSPERVDQRERIAAIDRLARLYAGRLAVVGVVRSAPDDWPAELDGSLAFPLVPAADMARQQGWSPHLAQGVAAGEGYILLEDQRGLVLEAGTDYPMQALGADLIRLFSGYIATDIDQSTWGKVKELFK